MKMGITIPRFVTAAGDAGIGPELAAIGRDADQAGLDSLWVMDHFFQIPPVGPVTEPMLEGYSALSYLAGITERIRLGTLVTGVTYRHPGILAKTVTTLDVLSGGRAWFGIGAGWYEREHEGLGVPFPPVSERFEMLEETIQIALQMWSGEIGPYDGKHFHLAETLCQPLPLSTPRPPIMIGGGGEKKTLRLVARYADACNLFAMPGEEGMAALTHKLDVLRAHCETEGRSYDAIEKTVIGPAAMREAHPMAMPPEAMPAFLEQLATLGIDHYISAVVDRASLHVLLNEVLDRGVLVGA
ncbi:MAG: LLM class F420-dependent oxidoreductase [Chloroflexia bacterium]|nr:LLM class F420-dependent oxidoreductase [Chloroflexia bacterium]